MMVSVATIELMYLGGNTGCPIPIPEANNKIAMEGRLTLPSIRADLSDTISYITRVSSVHYAVGQCTTVPVMLFSPNPALK